MPETFCTKGDVFGRLTVIKLFDYSKPNAAGKVYKRYKCRCVCGNTSIVLIGHLRSGHTQSCGCKLTDVLTERNLSHDLTNHPAYSTWNGIMDRCYNKTNPRYNDYDGRGIKVCKEWRNPKDGCFNFCTWAESNGHVKGKVQIDRKNNDKGYSPNNCHFTTNKNNMRNRRNTIIVIVDKKKIPFIEFWEKHGEIDYSLACRKLKQGFTPLQAVRKNK